MRRALIGLIAGAFLAAVFIASASAASYTIYVTNNVEAPSQFQVFQEKNDVLTAAAQARCAILLAEIPHHTTPNGRCTVRFVAVNDAESNGNLLGSAVDILTNNELAETIADLQQTIHQLGNG